MVSRLRLRKSGEAPVTTSTKTNCQPCSFLPGRKNDTINGYVILDACGSPLLHYCARWVAFSPFRLSTRSAEQRSFSASPAKSTEATSI